MTSTTAQPERSAHPLDGLITGLHHLTACVDGAQEDIDFVLEVIGQRMVKQTVLFDGENPVYHLYYADENGTPGTVMTTFPYKQIGWKGRRGSGQVKTINYSVPAASLDFWLEHLDRKGVQHGPIEDHLGLPSILFHHPSGLEFRVIGDDRDQRAAWENPNVPAEHGTRGLHSVTLSVRDTTETERFLTDGLNFRKIGEQGPLSGYEIDAGGPGRSVYMLHEPDLPAGSWTFGAGTVHHIALATANDGNSTRIKAHLEGLGYTDVSEIKDRNYFHSIYVRSPGGALFEVATTDIGFGVDEELEHLGERLLLPPWLEDRREELVGRLESITVPEYNAKKG